MTTALANNKKTVAGTTVFFDPHGESHSICFVSWPKPRAFLM